MELTDAMKKELIDAAVQGELHFGGSWLLAPGLNMN